MYCYLFHKGCLNLSEQLDIYACFSMLAYKKRKKTTTTDIQQTKVTLTGSIKSCWDTLRNFKTTPVRTRKTFFFPYSIFFNPTCLTSDCPQHFQAKNKSTFFFFLSSEEQLVAVVSFVYKETREADVWSNFYKGWGNFLDPPTFTRPLFSLAKTSSGVNEAVFQRLREEDGDIRL